MRIQALLASALLLVGSAAQAAYVAGVSPLPPDQAPRNACTGSAFKLVTRDAQFDQFGSPMLDLVAFGIGESTKSISFGFYVTDNTLMIPAFSLYEVSFYAGDSVYEYFVRYTGAEVDDNGAMPIGRFQYGYRVPNSNGIGYTEKVRDFSDDSGYFFANGTGAGLVSFGLKKSQLEALIPQSRGFDFGAGLRKLRARTATVVDADRPIGNIDYLIAHSTDEADATLPTSYRMRMSQTCP